MNNQFQLVCRNGLRAGNPSWPTAIYLHGIGRPEKVGWTALGFPGTSRGEGALRPRLKSASH